MSFSRSISRGQILYDWNARAVFLAADLNPERLHNRFTNFEHKTLHGVAEDEFEHCSLDHQSIRVFVWCQYDH